MNALIQKRKIIVTFVIISFSAFSVISAPAYATMINTGEIFKHYHRDLSRERINKFIDRSEIQKYLVAWGVSPEEAKARIDSLSDKEIENITSKMDQLPAGGDAIGTIVGAAVLIFIILLVTDILGFTDVFPFIKGNK
jgi:Family of unknown function (DUF6627)